MTESLTDERPALSRTKRGQINMMVPEKLAGAIQRISPNPDINDLLEMAWLPPLPADILLQALKGPDFPDGLDERWLNGYDLRPQFKNDLLAEEAGIWALWLPVEMEGQLWRHRQDGYLLWLPKSAQNSWTQAGQHWLAANFEPRAQPTVADIRESIANVVRYLREECGTQVVYFNASSLDPADGVHDYGGRLETASLVIHRLNYALYEISAEIGMSIVDVDRIVAELGGERHVRGLFDYSDRLWEAIGQEFLRIVGEIGLSSPNGLRKLILPQVGREFESGTIVAWHKAEGDQVAFGDDLFDLRVDEISRMVRKREGQSGQVVETNEQTSRRWTWTLRITAAAEGTIQKILIGENGTCRTDDLVAAVVDADFASNGHAGLPDDGRFLSELAKAAPFPAVANRLDSQS